MNTDVPASDQEMADAWHEFHEFVERVDELPVGLLVRNATTAEIPDEGLSAYDAPFGSEAEKAGAREWPEMVPRADGGDGAAITNPAREELQLWDDPAFGLFSDSDPITSGGPDPPRDLNPPAAEQPDVRIEGAGQFLDGDAGPEIADRIAEFVDRT